MDWQCTKCGEPITLAGGEAILDATRRHSRESVHAWTGARRTLSTGAEQRWLTPSERADRSERASASFPSSDGLSGHSAACPERETVRKTNKAERWAPAGIALYLVAGLVITIGIVAFPVSSTEEADRNPSGSSTALYPKPDSSPSESRTSSTTVPEGSSTPTPPTPLVSTAPAYAPEPGSPPNTTGGRPRDARGNDSYYDGNYNNDDEWHRKYGNPDQYYDGNYDNDGSYHRKYGRK